MTSVLSWSLVCSLFLRLALGWDCDLHERHLCAEVSQNIVLIDAGSTGSRIFVYNYPPRMLEAKNLPYIVHAPLTRPRLLGSVSARPGISSFIRDPSNISAYFHDLVMQAKDILLKQDEKVNPHHVPLYMGCTAGMRYLEKQDRDLVMKYARQYFKSDDCPFDFSLPEQARVISGEEEGVFGWLAINDARNSLSASPATTVGVLDMGGASAQITFVPKEPSILAGFFPMHFGHFSDGPIHVYTHSYQGFGYVLTFQQLSRRLHTAAQSNTFSNPCLDKGLVWNVTHDQYGMSVVVGSANVERSTGPIQMIGTGDFEICSDWAKELLPQDHCYMEPCSIAGVYQPFVDSSSFVAVGEYSQAYFLTMAAYATTPTLVAVRDGGVRLCAMSHDMQRELNLAMDLACWRVVWTYTFLTSGLGIGNNNSLEHMATEPDWTAGQAIYETNFFPYRLVEAIGPTSVLLSQAGLLGHIPRSIGLSGLGAREDFLTLSRLQLLLIIFASVLSTAVISVVGTRTMCRIPILYRMPQALREHLLDV